MKTSNLTPPDAEFQRTPFAQATAVQVSSAIKHTVKRLELHFPTLKWAVWCDTLQQVQPDLLVNGDEAYLPPGELSRMVQCLAASRELHVLDPPVYGATASQLVQERITYQRQAIRAMKELQQDPRACGPLMYELFTMLIKGSALAKLVYDATYEVGQQRLKIPNMKVIRKLLKQLNDCRRSAGLPVSRNNATDISIPLVDITPDTTSAQTGRRKSSVRRTFKDIVEKHRRPNGKTRFTSRELCKTMRISISSLSLARINPGRLSLDAVVALAEVMEEMPSQVVSDLLAEAKAKRREK